MKASNMISTKDLAYLEDIFQWNFNASKKANHYSDEIKLEVIKEASCEVAKMHARICRKIIEMLGGYNG